MIGPNKKPVEITSLTWNMGNKAASVDAVQDVMSQLVSGINDYPDVIAIATQEELASGQNRLQAQVLEKLNQTSAQKYKLVRTDVTPYHTTMAGANNSAKTLANSLLTSKNRVSMAILVKEPYDMVNPIARIDYEQGKDKGNKSIITMSGQLTCDQELVMDISISGAHLDSNHDSKRRAHVQKYLENNGSVIANMDTYPELLNEAKRLKILMGDFNERDKLYANHFIGDPGDQTNIAMNGFDMRAPQNISVSGQKLYGTYGFVFRSYNSPTRQFFNTPDPRGRANVTKGGHLDRVTVGTGNDYDEKEYGANLNVAFFNKEGKKWYYHGSDHTPVFRRVSIKNPIQKQDNQIVTDYIFRMMPNHVNDLEMLHNLKLKLADATKIDPQKMHQFVFFEGEIKKHQYHDSSLPPIIYFQRRFGVGEDQLKWQQKLDEWIDLKGASQFQMNYLESKLYSLSRLPEFGEERQIEILNIGKLVESYNRAKSEILCYQVKDTEFDNVQQRESFDLRQRSSAERDLENAFIKAVQTLRETNGQTLESDIPTIINNLNSTMDYRAAKLNRDPKENISMQQAYAHQISSSSQASRERLNEPLDMSYKSRKPLEAADEMAQSSSRVSKHKRNK